MRHARVAEHRQVQQLDRHPAADALVGAVRAPDAAAAALTEQRLDDVGADARALQRRLGDRQRGRGDGGGRFEELLGLRAGALAQQRLQLVRQRRVLGAQRGDARGAPLGLEIEHLVEQRAQPPPQRMVDGCHRAMLLSPLGSLAPDCTTSRRDTPCGACHHGRDPGLP
jgi:hypothetical protein